MYEVKNAPDLSLRLANNWCIYI